jgi:hypothetical protein
MERLMMHYLRMNIAIVSACWLAAAAGPATARMWEKDPAISGREAGAVTERLTDEPPTRFVYDLCAMGSPDCEIALRYLYDDALAKPWWGGIKQICPPERPPGRAAMFGDQMDPMDGREIHHWFMTVNGQDRAVMDAPARIGMLFALRAVWGCRG